MRAGDQNPSTPGYAGPRCRRVADASVASGVGCGRLPTVGVSVSLPGPDCPAGPVFRVGLVAPEADPVSDVPGAAVSGRVGAQRGRAVVAWARRRSGSGR